MSVLSLLLAAAMGGLWLYSEFRAVVWGSYSANNSGAIAAEWEITSAEARIGWRRVSYGSADGAGWQGHWSGVARPTRVFNSRPPGSTVSSLSLAGFAWKHRRVPLG